MQQRVTVRRCHGIMSNAGMLNAGMSTFTMSNAGLPNNPKKKTMPNAAECRTSFITPFPIVLCWDPDFGPGEAPRA
jgi:hypothetical protein